MTPTALNFVWALGGVLVATGIRLFAAGEKYANLQRDLEKSRSDVNGLGKKYGRVVALLIRWADTAEKREQIAEMVEPPK